MDKYAAEKIASDYYTVGVQLALQTLSNGGHTKTASKGKDIAKMLGLTGLGAGAGALGMRAMTPEISTALAKMTPSELAVVAKNVGGQRLAKADEVTQKIVSNLSPKAMEPGVVDSMQHLDIFDRLAMSGQAAKNMFTDPMNTLRALGLAAEDTAKGLKMTGEAIVESPITQRAAKAVGDVLESGARHGGSKMNVLEHL